MQRQRSQQWTRTVELLEGIRTGFNVLFESPRYFSCYGIHPTDAFAAVYQNASYFCRQPQFSDRPAAGNSYLVRRGTAFKSDWRKQIDLNLQADIKQERDLFDKLRNNNGSRLYS